MSELKQAASHDDLVDEITDVLPFNHGMVIASVWQAHFLTGDERERKLRVAAHYLGRALDREFTASQPESYEDFRESKQPKPKDIL